MARKNFQLTTSVVKSSAPRPGLNGPTLINDGNGLYLQIMPTGIKSWIYRYYIGNKKTRSMGLGSTKFISLEDARKRARECRVLIDKGVDPIAARDQNAIPRSKLMGPAELTDQPSPHKSDGKTFEWCANEYLNQVTLTHRNKKHSAQWRTTIESYANPKIGKKDVDDIDAPDLVEILEPLFKRVPTTAQRLQQRLEKIFAWSIVLEHRKNKENPARWKLHLREAIPAASAKSPAKHHNALPYAEMPAFMAHIRQDGSDGSVLLQFIILTMCRTGEARGAAWDEISADFQQWTVPGERMKGGVEHRVPLSPRAQAILRHQKEKNDQMVTPSVFVFPGRNPKNPISDAAALEFLKRIKRTDCTPHGMRSAARSWAAECTDFPREVCEQALAHKLRDRVEAAYQRGDYLEKRRALMTAWASYCESYIEPASTAT